MIYIQLVNGLTNQIEELSQFEIAESTQRSAYNLKSSLITGVNAANAMMANEVMKAEVPPDQVTEGYNQASDLLQGSLSRCAKMLSSYRI